MAELAAAKQNEKGKVGHMNGKLLGFPNSGRDIECFEEKIYDFTNGEIDRKAYKGFSGGLAVMARGRNGYSMLRLRLPGGRLTKETA
jgi:ferredoxin-nitrite reductase